MPRTKRPTSKARKTSEAEENKRNGRETISESVGDVDSYIKCLDVEFAKQMTSLKEKKDRILSSLSNSVEMAKLRLGPEIGNKTLAELTALDMDHINEVSSGGTVAETPPAAQNQSPRTSPYKQRTTRGRSKSQDEGVGSSRSGRTSRSQSVDIVYQRRTRNSSQGRENMLPPTALPNRFRTPNVNLAVGGTQYNTITPKVQPNCMVNILRRPREGELAFAMSGSPLLVNSGGIDLIANVNIPLSDGRVMSILPELGLRARDIPDGVDPTTMAQLDRLRENLNSILGYRK